MLAEDLSTTLVPRFDLDQIISKINNPEQIAIEFIGKQGRGKTTHLIYLQKLLAEYPIFLLNSKSTFHKIINHRSNVVFIDSIHHLNLFDRIHLFKKKETVIYTTHWNRKIECLIARKKYCSLNFNGIDPKLLKEIIHRRLKLAADDDSDHIEIVTTKEVNALIKKFGDNYRGIINHLYEKYQNGSNNK